MPDPAELAHLASSDAPKAVLEWHAMKGAGWMARRVLDPPLQVAGKRLAECVADFKLRNVKNYLRRAEHKLSEPPAEGSRIHDRVLISVTEAASSDDTLMAEYFGGILASAFNPDDRDDRGVAWTALVSRLSAYEIHLHYLVYDAWHRLLAGSQTNLSMDEGRSKADLWVPKRDLFQAMGSSGLDAMGQTVVGLRAESLLGDPFVFGDGESVPTLRGKSVGYGLFVRPSLRGVNLFLWAHGHGQRSAHDFTLSELAFEVSEPIIRLENATLVSNLEPEPPEGSPTAAR